MEEDVFRISPDFPRAKDLIAIAKDRIEIIKILPKDKVYKIIEEYYEIILELITAIMYCDGYKTLSHKSAIEYLSGKYNEVNEKQIGLIDSLRKSRHGIVYYGKMITKEFLINNEADIKKVIEILTKTAQNKVNGKD